jgi:hypothetical protein
MISPKRVGDLLREYFESATPENFRADVARYCPEAPSLESSEQIILTEDGIPLDKLGLSPAGTALIPLQGYVASALTGLTTEQRQLMFQVADTIVSVCKEFEIDIYEPRKRTDPVVHPDIPDYEVFLQDRQRVLDSDLLILLCHYASFGAGQELDFAYNALLPVVLISHHETRVSRMVTGMPSLKLHITYTEPDDLRNRLRQSLGEIRPILEERKLAFSAYDSNIVGMNIRRRREALELTREDIAANAEYVTVGILRQIEEHSDKVSNPSLIQLRQIAAILKTTVADLIEPDYSWLKTILEKSLSQLRGSES